MKKWLLLGAALTLCLAAWTATASAVTNGMVKVGLYYGSSALYSANAEIVDGYGSGFSFGYYDESRNFVSLASVSESSVCVTADGNIGYTGGEISASGASVLGGCHVQLPQSYASFAEAQSAANQYGGFVAFVNGAYFVRVGSYASLGEAQSASYSLGGSAVSPSSTAVTVTKRGVQTILFQFDFGGLYSFAVQPIGSETRTYFKSHKYYGGFEYPRVSGGNLYVVSVVDLEHYVKCVVPYEMSNSWPVEALKAQAVCARTYVTRSGAKHASYGFDVCASTDCQVYYGVDYGTSTHTDTSDAAVDATAGVCMYSGGQPIYAVYSASDGGATEDAYNVWGTRYSYLVGKADPYEAAVSSSISGYSYTLSYTAAELTSRIAAKGYSGYRLGTITNVYVSQYTAMGNVYAVTFEDAAGNSYTVTGEKCRTALGTKSQRFEIGGGSASAGYSVNGSGSLSTLTGSYVISGSGTVRAYSGADSSTYVITSSGVSAAEKNQGASAAPAASSGAFAITGTGNGHNVGLSQWGANAMAKQGYAWRDILNFYYTGITIS